MKLLLTSGGITNDTLAAELERLVGKKFGELKIGFIPTAAFVEAGDIGWLIDDVSRLRTRGAEISFVEIAQLSELEIQHMLEPVDVIFVGGGNTFYLSYWMQQKGLFASLPKLLETKIYAGISAGSIVVGSTLRVTSDAMNNELLRDEEYEELGPEGRSSAKTLGLVDFAIRPHLNSRYFPNIRRGQLQVLATELGQSVYAIDDASAICVEDGSVACVGEGEWQIIEPEK